MDRRLFLAGTASSLVAVLRPDSLRAAAATGGARHFPNVELVTHDGRKVRFYDDLMKNKVVLINFFYTQCDGICTPVTANLRKVQDLLGDKVGRTVFMYSFSLKPVEDTPKELRSYMSLYDVKPGWTFVTGPPKNCDLIRRRLGFADLDPVVDRDLTQHSGLVVFGNERLDRWSACPAVVTASEIVKAVSWVET